MSFLKRGQAAREQDGALEPARARADRAPAWEGWRGLEVAGTKAGLFRTCANPYCASGWLHLWRRRETPIFEGGWCCSPQCTAARVEAAIRREMDARGSGREFHRHRIPLGLAMLKQGWITLADLRAALASQRALGGGKLGEWLVRQRSVNEEQVTRALGLQWGCPVLNVESQNPGGLTALIPRLFVDAFGALPLRIATGKILYMGFEDRVDPALALAVERITGLRVECGLVQASFFRPAHARILEAQFPQAKLIEAASGQTLAKALSAALETARSAEARLARVHDCLWLRIWQVPQAGPLPERGSIQDLIGSAAVH